MERVKRVSLIAESAVSIQLCCMLNNELERMRQVVVISQHAVLSQQLYGVTEGNNTMHKYLE
jgi:hypothetical protein